MGRRSKVSLYWQIRTFGNRHAYESLLQLRVRERAWHGVLTATLGGPSW